MCRIQMIDSFRISFLLINLFSLWMFKMMPEKASSFFESSSNSSIDTLQGSYPLKFKCSYPFLYSSISEKATILKSSIFPITRKSFSWPSPIVGQMNFTRNHHPCSYWNFGNADWWQIPGNIRPLPPFWKCHLELWLSSQACRKIIWIFWRFQEHIPSYL